MTTLEERVAALEAAPFGKADKMEVEEMDCRIVAVVDQATQLAALIAAEAGRHQDDIRMSTRDGSATVAVKDGRVRMSAKSHTVEN